MGIDVTETEQTRTDSEFEAAGRILRFWCPKQNFGQAIDNKLSKYHGPELFSKSVCLSPYRSLISVAVLNEVTVKVKVTLQQAMKAQRESTGIGLIFL
jgi:hypothetical protein